MGSFSVKWKMARWMTTRSRLRVWKGFGTERYLRLFGVYQRLDFANFA
jgi:hypothetical protein